MLIENRAESIDTMGDKEPGTFFGKLVFAATAALMVYFFWWLLIYDHGVISIE